MTAIILIKKIKYIEINSIPVDSEFTFELYTIYGVKATVRVIVKSAYTFGLNQTFKLSYDKNDTASYFYVRNYNNYEDQYISITPDMVDTVYEQNKSYYTDFSAFSINYPRFTEVGLSNNIISVGAYNWYRIDYSANESLYNLIGKSTNCFICFFL